MQRRTQRTQLRLITELSLAPLLGLVVVLLLVFMVSGPLLQDVSAAQKASAPDAASTTPESIARLTVDKHQAMWLDGNAIEQTDLNNALATLVKTKPGTGVLVQIDPSVPVHGLIALMDALRKAGVQKTAVKTLEK